MTTALMMVQVCIGAMVFAGAWLTLRNCIDKRTPKSRRVVFVLMLFCGAWYGLEPLILGVPTSTKPGLLFAACCAWIMLRWRRTLVAAEQLH